jgi:uncharacterized protein (TIGR02147 family)
MVNTNSSYRIFLKEVLADRVRKNPSYSLRALAKQVGLASSTLCEIMKGKGNLSFDSAQRVASRLGLEGQEAEYFCLLVQLESAKSPETKDAVLNQLRRLQPEQKIHDLSLDHFKVISDWYYSAILELTYLDRFELTPANISKKLRITQAEAEVAIERLLRLELLELTSQGKLKKTVDYVQAQSAVPSEAIRKHYRQTLEKAMQAIDTQTPQEKVSGAETLPIDPERLLEAKAIVDRFFSEMIALSKSCKKKSAVYNLNVHFFNLTPKENERK